MVRAAIVDIQKSSVLWNDGNMELSDLDENDEQPWP